MHKLWILSWENCMYGIRCKKKSTWNYWSLITFHMIIRCTFHNLNAAHKCTILLTLISFEYDLSNIMNSFKMKISNADRNSTCCILVLKVMCVTVCGSEWRVYHQWPIENDTPYTCGIQWTTGCTFHASEKGIILTSNDRCEGQFQWAFDDIQSQFTSVEDQYISKASHIFYRN